MQPPNQELVVRDLHDNTYTFRHIYRGENAFSFAFSSLTELLMYSAFMLKINVFFSKFNANPSCWGLAKVVKRLEDLWRL